MLKTVEYFLRYSGEAVVGVHLRKTKWGWGRQVITYTVIFVHKVLATNVKCLPHTTIPLSSQVLLQYLKNNNKTL